MSSEATTRLADLERAVQEATAGEPQLLTVAELAERLRVKPSWVYLHADDLGAFRLGKYLRFSWPRVLERLEGGEKA